LAIPYYEKEGKEGKEGKTLCLLTRVDDSGDLLGVAFSNVNHSIL
jgi:hypothetical protein